MIHLLALYAATPKPVPPGTFTVAGHAVPSILGQILHWIAKLFVILAMIIVLVILKFRERTPIWQLIIVMIIGAVALPHTSQKVAQGVNTVTSGSSVASTGASIGLILLMAGLVTFTVIVLPILRRRAMRKMMGGGEEE